ncbi:alpha/beta hydrolase [Vibrio sp. 16]|uniref:alpha/beta hydrolase n=1 Tax=Vibrio sp. 16 TaxID=391586 RepID=UPI00018F4053|nr:alpha/beta hydrolase [Vibrio sp. 16]EED27352.1 conserved hypothetical protein [Vibrio sp. 16]CAK4066818.1 hypothetical protein VDT1_0174 [Vibrio sp. 16]
MSDMSSNFVICVRNVKGKGEQAKFGNEPGTTRYLEVPDGQSPHPQQHRLTRTEWLERLLVRARTGKHDTIEKSPVSGYTIGDILIFVHGYNNSITAIMHRHDLLQKRLREVGYKGAIVSFDWPSAQCTLNYAEDRCDAKQTALKLVKDGIVVLAKNQLEQDRNHCDIDVHLLGHSTGAYVIREAFYEAKFDRYLQRIKWNVSQIALIGGDIARKSTHRKDGKSQALFEHAIRITNYQNPHDNALKISNIKRLGAAPRVGRVGLDDSAPDNLVNVRVDRHWKQLDEDKSAVHPDANWTHSWHFDDKQFARDLLFTLQGDVDRASIETREKIDGELHLKVSEQ